MGIFVTTDSITYFNNADPAVQAFAPITVDDGDADTTFETGDTNFEPGANITYVFEGTMVLDGIT